MARGVDYGIGPVGNLAPPPDPAQLRGRIVGLKPAVKFISDVLTPLGVARSTARQRVREHNDDPGFRIEGQTGGSQVRTDPPPGRVWPMPPASAGPDPDDVRAAGAKQAGQENRAAYRRWMGTPARPPRGSWGGEREEPFDEGGKHFQKPKPAKPMDTTDIRRRSP